MAITINGNGTVTGISAGGLPAGSLTLRNIDMPSGTSLQTVASPAGSSDMNVTSTSWTNIGHTATITTLAANSKILVELTGGGWHDNGNNQATINITFERNFDGGSYSSPSNAKAGASEYGLMRMSADGENWNIGPYACSLLVSPAQAVGTVIIYRVLIKKDTNGNSQYQSNDRGMPMLTLTEIAA